MCCGKKRQEEEEPEEYAQPAGPVTGQPPGYPHPGYYYPPPPVYYPPPQPVYYPPPPPPAVVPPAPAAPSTGSAGVWVDTTDGQVPPGALPGGQDVDGEQMYVARAKHEGAIIPGKLVPSHGGAYVPWGGQEHGKSEYQVLVGGSNNWVQTNGSNIPANAFQGGRGEDGEPLYIGRVHHEGSVTIGKVVKSHGCCYIPYGGQEISFDDYEILVV